MRARALSLALCAGLLACEAAEASDDRPEPVPLQVRPDPAPTASASASASEDPVEHRDTIVLVVLDGFPDDLLDAVEDTLRRELGVDVRRHGVEPLPRSAYYAPRRRYRADRLLEHLLTFTDGQPPETRFLGLTRKDISTTKGKHHDWGIFGLGYTPGRAAVVSSYRLRRGARDRKQIRFRVANTALHEVGHMFGLPHCSEARCPMRDAHGSIASTDDSRGQLGPRCQARLDGLADPR